MVATNPKITSFCAVVVIEPEAVAPFPDAETGEPSKGDVVLAGPTRANTDAWKYSAPVIVTVIEHDDRAAFVTAYHTSTVTAP